MDLAQNRQRLLPFKHRISACEFAEIWCSHLHRSAIFMMTKTKGSNPYKVR